MTKINIRGQKAEIDDNCISLIKFFNSIGLDTKFCCEGHKVNEPFYIMFEDYIDDEQIVSFIENYSNKYDHTPFCGKFVKWVRKMKGEIKFNWEYIAQDKVFAQKDYNTMISKYNKF
ncbi:TPA: hypothetical protein ACXDAY_002155 [Clostridium botulinum]|uniref:hypothetical protein n=1 Tax=Clostridium botulinum TaxID=1491 RepID=UPI0004660595|nr:hypothetical protein [Clostridium botulinum]APR02576.1 hypothetical protein RSJ2_4033 [Clostridium botulinum]AUN01554.1 hypothetical protein RSJ19_00805 [Clostridium botulinum]MBN3359272.1 hypothetical protein [Clostridium botulinum]